MGLFDSLAGQALGTMLSGKGDKGLSAQVAMEMIYKNGGLEGILEQFNQNGLGELSASWVSQGSNKPLSPDQVSTVFGNNMINEMAKKFGVDSSLLTNQVAQYLPELVNQATPAGNVDAKSEGLLGNILSMLIK